MIKKSVISHSKVSKQKHFVKTIIFDLSGVLLIKKNSSDLIKNPESTSPLVVVNFVETLALLKACKSAGHNLYVLSNLSVVQYSRIQQEPEIASLFSFFDDIVISGMTPYEKPETEIFTYFFDLYNVKPENCIFIDDKQDNLNGANLASISKTILCSNFDLKHVRSELVVYGALLHNDALELNIPTGQA